MFTGIIEASGIVTSVETRGTNSTFWITSSISPELKIDQSLSHDGVCLTVEEIVENKHRVTAILETLEKTNLGRRIAHGALIVGYMSTVSTISIDHVIHKDGLADFPVNAGYDRIRFLKPVLLGDTVTAHYTVTSVDKERGRSVAKVEVLNQKGDTVAVADHIMRWARKLSSTNA